MVIELETGGNIRLEDGSMNDLWYASCVDLVKSRSFIQDFKELGVRGINIVRVTRIHNRCLRHKFEETVHNITTKREQAAQSEGNSNGNNKNLRLVAVGRQHPATGSFLRTWSDLQPMCRGRRVVNCSANHLQLIKSIVLIVNPPRVLMISFKVLSSNSITK